MPIVIGRIYPILTAAPSVPEQLPTSRHGHASSDQTIRHQSGHELFRVLSLGETENVMPLVVLDDGMTARRELQVSTERVNCPVMGT